LFDVVTPAEIPIDINAFKSQQHRWAKGSIQTAVKLLPTILGRPDIRPFKKLQAVMHLTHYCVHPLILTMTLLVLPILLWGQPHLTPWIIVPLVGIMFMSLFGPNALYLVAERAAYPERLWRTVVVLPALMVVGVGLAVNNTRGVLGALFGKKERSVFARTPKLGQAAEHKQATAGLRQASEAPAMQAATGEPDRIGDRAYRMKLSKFFLLELLVGSWATAAFTAYLSLFKMLVGPILFIHAVGFLSVGIISVVHEWRARTLKL
jgi:hypothetical protein